MKINPKSIIFKVSLLYIFITILNVTIFNIVVWENQTELIMDNTILESQNIGSRIRNSIDQIVHDTMELTPSVLLKVEKEQKKLWNNGFTIWDENGKQLYSTINTTKEDASQVELAQIISAITKRTFENRLFTHTLHNELRLVDLYIPFSYGRDKNGVVFTVFQMKDLDAMMGLLYRQCILISVVVIIIHLMFAAAITKMVIVPLRKLISATKEVSSGNFTVRVPNFGTDELGMLASSFNEMSTAVSKMQDEAKGANPLTGLPGNITISQHIDFHINSYHQFAVLYCDLDNFKAYNDKYGFTRGDDAILYSRDTLLEASEVEGVHDVFVGHEGGDDFVVITPLDCWEIFAKTFVELFDKDIKQFYNETDAKNGFIASVNRQGDPQEFPLMSMSVAVVTNEFRNYSHHAELVQVAAELKKFAKKHEGSNYKVDKRRD